MSSADLIYTVAEVLPFYIQGLSNNGFAIEEGHAISSPGISRASYTRNQYDDVSVKLYFQSRPQQVCEFPGAKQGVYRRLRSLLP